MIQMYMAHYQNKNLKSTKCSQEIFKNVYLLLRERERERERARAGEGQSEGETEDPRQALCWQQRALHGAWTHKPWDHDLSWSQPLNWLNHPGPPVLSRILIYVSENEKKKETYQFLFFKFIIYNYYLSMDSTLFLFSKNKCHIHLEF